MKFKTLAEAVKDWRDAYEKASRPCELHKSGWVNNCFRCDEYKSALKAREADLLTLARKLK